MSSGKRDAEEEGELGGTAAQGAVGETRRIQLTGRSTYVVSLPIEWVRSVGLRPKSEVYLAQLPDMSLLVVPKKRVSRPAEATIEVAGSTSEGQALRAFIAHYVAGYDSIRILFDQPNSQIRSKLKAHIRDKLIGVEIVEETSSSTLTQCLHGQNDLPLTRALRRMGLLAGSMQTDACNALVSGDAALAQQVLERDDEVDRFSHFILRQLNLAINDRNVIHAIGLKKAQDCLYYNLIVRSIERIADHATQIATSAASVDTSTFESRLLGEVSKMSQASHEMYQEALSAVYARDKEKVDATISKLDEVLSFEETITQSLISSGLDAKTVAAFRLAIESVRRIAEYSVDLCELVVDMDTVSKL